MTAPPRGRWTRFVFLMALAAAGCASPPPEWLAPPRGDPPVVADDLVPAGPPAGAPEVVDGRIELSVEQAALLALRRNRGLAVELITPEIVATFEEIERGVFDPEVFARAQWGTSKAQETSRATGESFGVSSRTNAIAAGAAVRTPLGTEAAVDLEVAGSDSDRSPSQQEARLGVTLTQALLRGFGTDVNLASIRIAEFDTAASIHELRGFAEALLADVEIAYWRFVVAREELAIYEESLAVAERQWDEIRQRIEVGILPETEAAAARAEIALRQQALLDARSVIEDRRLRLLRLVNPVDEGALALAVTPTSDFEIDPLPREDPEERIRLAETIRPDLLEARTRLEQRRLETIVTRDGLLPRLDLFLLLGKSGYAGHAAAAVGEFGGEDYDLTAGIEFRQFLGNRGARAAHRGATASARQAAASVENLRQLVRLDVLTAANELSRAEQQIDASAATRTLQEESYRAERARFEVGESTSLLLAQAQRDLLESRIAEVRAVVDYRIALVNLYRAEGSLLSRRGIVVGPDAAKP